MSKKSDTNSIFGIPKELSVNWYCYAIHCLFFMSLQGDQSAKNKLVKLASVIKGSDN